MQKEDRSNVEKKEGVAGNPQEIFSWKAPLRPYRKRSGKIIRFYLALALLLSLIIYFFGSKVLLVPIWTLLFLFYVLTVTPSPKIENKITKFGIETAGITVRWENLSHFYFIKKFGQDVLTIVTNPPFNYHIYLVVPDKKTKEKVKLLLSEHLVYKEKPPKSLTDKIADFLQNLVPDEEVTSKGSPAAV